MARGTKSFSHVVFVALAFLCSVELFEISASPAPGKLVDKLKKKLGQTEDEFIKPLPEKGNPSALIVGAGPVGLYSAAKLAQKGFSVTIIEKNTDYLERQHMVGVWHDGAREILNRNLPGAGCITLSPDVAKYPQCLDTQRRDSLIASSDGALSESDFLQTFTANEILDGFQLEFTETAHKQRTGNHVVKVMDLWEISEEMLDRADVVLCADGADSECRDVFMEFPYNHPILFRASPEYPWVQGGVTYDWSLPDAYGATIAVKAEHLPEERRQEFLVRASSERLSSAQHLYRGFLGSDGLLYVGLALTRDEYKQLDGMDQKSDDFRAAFLQVVRPRILGALYFYDMWDLRDVVREHGTFTAFPIRMQHQDKTGFASIVPRTGKWGKRSGDQIAIIVGDAAISSHFFSVSGLSLGLQVADAAISFLDRDVLAPNRKLAGKVKNFFGYLDRKKKKVEEIVAQINEAAFNIVVEGRKRSIAVLPPWAKDPLDIGVVV
ncbi:hypothetical protein HK102_012258 [Quaeritorhiza haematococci]|nr:hypothetical protein HK102_012258 [Quaeritorhiza haematococci]